MQDKAKSFMLIMGQCVQPLRTTLESRTEFPEIRKKRDVVALMKMIETLVFGMEKTQNTNWRLAKQEKKFRHLKQDNTRLLAQAEAVKKCGGVLVPANKVNAGDQEKEAAEAAHLACV